MESNIWESVAMGGPFAVLFAWLLWWVVTKWWPEQRTDHKEQMDKLLASCERQHQTAVESNERQWDKVNNALEELASAIHQSNQYVKMAYEPKEQAVANRH